MEPELCPPWWPELLWSLLHHEHHPGPPPPEEWLRDLEEVLAALAVFVQAQASFGLRQEELRGQVQHAALGQINGAIERLAKMSKAEG